MMSIADLSSSYIGVRLVCSLSSTVLMYLTVFAAVTAAINSASVELRAVIDCDLEWYTIAPPEYVSANPAVDLLLLG